MANYGSLIGWPHSRALPPPALYTRQHSNVQATCSWYDTHKLSTPSGRHPNTHLSVPMTEKKTTAAPSRVRMLVSGFHEQ